MEKVSQKLKERYLYLGMKGVSWGLSWDEFEEYKKLEAKISPKRPPANWKDFPKAI